MPSSLKHLSKKPKSMPKGDWKGAGYYYRRDDHTWQKYSQGKDAKRGRGVGKGKWKHTHDRKK